MKGLKLTLAIALTSILAVGAGQAQESADEIMKKSHLAYYYAADDGLAEVTMTMLDKKGKERNREFTMLRLDNEEGATRSTIPISRSRPMSRG